MRYIFSKKGLENEILLQIDVHLDTIYLNENSFNSRKEEAISKMFKCCDFANELYIFCISSYRPSNSVTYLVM